MVVKYIRKEVYKWKDEGESPAAARMAEGNRRQGARVMASFKMIAPAPPDAELLKHRKK